MANTKAIANLQNKAVVQCGLIDFFLQLLSPILFSLQTVGLILRIKLNLIKICFLLD
jgi:hypothetical protein